LRGEEYMGMRARGTRFGRTVTLLVLGIAAGSLLSGPAVAHVGARIPHLKLHLDGTYLNQGEKAADSNQLDGLDSTAFLRSGGKAADADQLDGLDSSSYLRATGKAADASLLDGVDSAAFVQGATLLSRQFSCPGSGFSTIFAEFGHNTDTEGLRYLIGGAGVLRCPVHLPNNAVVTGVTFTVLDADNSPTTDNVEACRLLRTDLTIPTGAEENVSTPVSTSGTPGEVALAAPSLVAAATAIANGSWAYSFECKLNSGTVDNGIYGAVVTYTVSAANG
jgi:hypothetical protein